MDITPAEKIYRTSNCTWPIEAGKYAHLSVRVSWCEGAMHVRPVAVEEPRILEAPELFCEADLDGEWLTLVVHGPGEIPARATVVVTIKRELAQPLWLAERRES